MSIEDISCDITDHSSIKCMIFIKNEQKVEQEQRSRVDWKKFTKELDKVGRDGYLCDEDPDSVLETLLGDIEAL